MKFLLRIIFGFCFSVFGLVALISCFSYHSTDASFNTATTAPTQNIFGVFGAYTSDILLQLFGFTGFLIPFAFLSTGLMLLTNKKFIKLRLTVFLLGLLTLCWSLGPSFIPSNGVWTNAKGGGFIGFYLSEWLGKSSSIAIYFRLGFYLLSAALIILGLHLPITRITTLFSTTLFSRLSKIKLPKTKKLEFKLPTFKIPLQFAPQEALATQSVEQETQDENPNTEVKEKPSLFSFIKREKTVKKERIEPTFDNETDFSVINAEEPAYIPQEKENVKRNVKEKQQISIPQQQDKNKLELPSTNLLDPVKSNNTPTLSKETMQKTSKELEEVLAQFSITGKIVTAHPGPVVTLYEFQPSAGIKSARIITLADDIAMKMRVVSVRIAVIPGTDAVGIEMPNIKREVVYIREMIEHTQFKNNSGALPLILGKDIGGAPVFADLAKMPHLLVAGTTGSGKSVAINTMVLSLIYRFTPAECRLIMVDPKMVELSVYNRIPHLLTPVVVDPEKVVIALKWAVREMEDRYTSMSHLGVRNIEGYNQKLKQAAAEGKSLTRRVQTGFDPETGRPIYEEQEFDLTPIPYIVIIIDEMADLMGRCGKEVDPLIQRLAQMARAVGIHLILATQRPSVDVITGTIKSNFPSRMSFQVRSKTDSRTILDEHGAERLLGKGDMLFMPAGQRPQRVHGPFVSDKDVEQVVHHWELQAEPQYLNAVTTDPEASSSATGGSKGGDIPNGGDLYDQAVAIILRDQKVSTSYVQRQLRIGYNKAADLIDRMEAEGVISKPNVAGKREILVPTVNA